MGGWIVVGAAALLTGAWTGCRWLRRRNDQVLCHERFEDWLREEQARRRANGLDADVPAGL
jgi:hypothetical protein